MVNVGITDFIEAIVGGSAIEYMTQNHVKQIAQEYNIPEKNLQPFVGMAITALIFFLESLDNWDIHNAVNASTTGKVKLVSYYIITLNGSAIFQDFKPWNSSYIDVPATHSFTWHEGEYDIDDIVCEHNFNSYTSNNTGSHLKHCSLCTTSVIDTCQYICSNYSRTKHKARCRYCQYFFYENHSWNIGGNICLSCGFNTEGSLLRVLGNAQLEMYLLE